MFSEGLSACDLLGSQSKLEGVCRVQIFDLYSVREQLVGAFYSKKIKISLIWSSDLDPFGASSVIWKAV